MNYYLKEKKTPQQYNSYLNENFKLRATLKFINRFKLTRTISLIY